MEARPDINIQEKHSYPAKRKPRGEVHIEKLIALKSKGLNLDEIAQLMGIHKQTAWRHLKNADLQLELTEHYRKHRATVLAFEQNRIRQHITDEKLSKASARDLVLCYGILYDKERLETGQSTQNILYADVVKARMRVEEEIAELENGSPG